MKYDSSIVGEKVINAAGKEGTIVSVSRDGAVKVKFVGDVFDGEFMFDPFLSGHIKFANQELQTIIDDEIAKEYQKTFYYSLGMRTCRVHLVDVLRMANLL